MNFVPLGELFAERVPSVTPQNHPDEMFELWSIPAFDTGKPEIVPGSEIGSAKKCLEPGDVLLSKIVPHIRRSWIVGTRSECRQIGSGEWIVFRSPRFIPQYLRHFLTSDEFHAKFMGTIAGVGGSLMRARPEAVKKFEVSLPSLDEQRRIAAILDKADELRRQRQETLTHSQRLLSSIFESHFPTASRSTSEMISLGNLADIQVGHAFQSAKYTDEIDGVRLCRGANVLPGRLDWEDLARWPAMEAGPYSHLELRANDIIVAMDRPWISEGFKIARVKPSDLPALLVQRVARIRASEEDLGLFLFHLLRQPEFTRHCKPTETTVPHISPKEIRNYVVARPSGTELESFANEVRLLTDYEARQGEQLTCFDALFASLQHRAFRSEL